MLIDGEMVIHKLVSKLLLLGDYDVVIAAPEWDRGGCFESVVSSIGDKRLSVYYGSSDSPLERILGAVQVLADNNYVCRIDGLNLFIREEDVLRMLNQAKVLDLDVLKFPDDFPPAYGCDVYRVGALRSIESAAIDRVFHAHPKFYMFKNKAKFSCGFYTEFRPFDDSYLNLAREKMRPIYDFKRLDVIEGDRAYVVPSANQITFHYEMVLDRLGDNNKVLDLACGNGFGSRILAANKTNYFIGIDIDPKIIDQATALSSEYDNLRFEQVDILNNSLESKSFDVVIAFEIIEHVPPDLLLDNIARVLKKGGVFYLSTPQNSLGHIPICYEHTKEYGLMELRRLVEGRFKILEFLGIKQGNVIFDGDMVGNNSFLVGVKL
jgi:2-polyprenyl-3-methyl-5-hydroxy-6-metoxy-1,4-benzoquinol methylase